MRYVVTPALASTATQNDDDTMVVDEPQGPANGELGLDERTDELNLKVRVSFFLVILELIEWLQEP
jgi:hypothetical protein